MTTLKAMVRKPRTDGLYSVYIRVVHNRKPGYIKTPKIVDAHHISNDGEPTDPVVNEYCAMLIRKYSDRLNRTNTSLWSVKEVIDYLLETDEEICFSDYAKLHIKQMLVENRERTAKNYKLAVAHLERYIGTTQIMFSQLTANVLKKWIESLSNTNRAKEMYPTCIRQIFKAAITDLNDDEWERLGDACNDYSQKKLYIYDSGYATIADVRAILRRLKSQDESIGLCVIDYIGLMMSNSNFNDRHLQVSEISRGLKLLARELDMPIIALSQLNRGLEQRANKRPLMSDLRESGAIEQDADAILFVYRDEVYREQEEKERENKAKAEGKAYQRLFIPNPMQENAEIIVGKNRNGPVGTIEVVFLKEKSCFVDKPIGYETTEFTG